jgi:16S rRNA processing protein RimM
LTQSETYILVGKLGRARGVKGDIFVTPATDFPDRFLNLREIYLEDSGAWQRRKIEASRLVSGRPVLKFAGVDSSEEAARLTNRGLAVPPDQLVELPEGVHYVFDLVGCTVYDTETDRRLGEVTDVQRYPANDVYMIKTEDGREVMLPAVARYVKEIDTKNKRIVIETAGLPDMTDQ